MRSPLGRRLRALLLAWMYISVLAVPGVLLAGGRASAQTPVRQITDCSSEYGNAANDSVADPAQGTVAYAVQTGGTWTFACSGRPAIPGPFLIPITTTLTVASGEAVTLTVVGSPGVALDTALVARIFEASGSLTLDGLELEGGDAIAGGAVYNNGGTVTVSHADFVSNQATGTNGMGGAIYNDGGTLTVSNSTFEGNGANVLADSFGAGGAIANTGTVSISNSTFYLNGVGDGGFGGAIYNDGGTLAVSNSTFHANFIGNSDGGSPNASGYGGAIYNNAGKLTVSGSTFEQNVSGLGTGAGFGGAIYNHDGATLTLANSTFSEDFNSGTGGTGGGAGGAIDNEGTLTVASSTFSKGGSSGSGGAIGNGSSGRLTVTGSTFDQNVAKAGGGGAISDGSSGQVTVTDSTFSENGTTAASGGAISDGSTSQLTVTGSTFNENAAAGGGGAIDDEGTLAVTDSTFSENGATTGGGGAISDGSSSELGVTDSTFSANIAAGSGGAIGSGSSSQLSVRDATFSANVASGSGGAIGSGSSSQLSVRGSTFSANIAAGGGGAISDGSSSELGVTDSTFSANIASGSGGAIGNGSSSQLTVTASTLSANGAGTGGGNLYGGGELNNTIVANPAAGGNCGGGTYSGTNDLEYGDAINTCTGTVTDWVNGDPILLGPGPNGGPTDTMVLAAGSAGTGMGDAAICAANPFDQRGYPRPPSGCDLGAYESTAPSAGQLPFYGFTSTPIAATGSLTEGGTVTATVYAKTYDGNGAPHAPVYLSFTGTGSAVADGVTLTATPQFFSTDTSGQVQVSYTAGPPLLGGGTDTLTASGVSGAGFAPTTDTYAYPAPAAGLAFATAPLSGQASALASLGPIQVELQQVGGGSAEAPPGGVTVTLGSSAPTGGFSGTLGGKPSPTLPVTIPAGASVSANVYFGDTASGTPTVTASASGLGPASQQETVTSGPAGFVTLAPQVYSLPVNGTTTVSGLVYDSQGNPVADPSVTLAATAGGFSTVSTVYGGYRATFQAPSTPGAVTVTASVYGGATAETLLLVTPESVTAQSFDSGDGSAGVKDLTASGGGGTGYVEVVDYSGNPGGTPTFESSGVYFDVALAQGNSFGSLVLTRCGVSAGQALYWWSGTAWAAVSSSPPPSYSAATGCLSVTLDGSSSPSLTDLTATPFAVGAAPVGGGGGGGGYVAPAPAVTGIAPRGGLAAGGTNVTITGSGFTDATAVDFGGTPAASFTVDSDTQVTAASPPGSGTVDVTVTTPAGTSATSAADRFSYIAVPKTPPGAVTFSDVPSTYWAYADIEQLAAKGIVNGFPGGAFRPDAAVTRAQFVKMLDLTLGLKPSAAPTRFGDVAASAWYAPYVSAAVRAGIVGGVSPTMFDPNGMLTREQMAVLVARALKLTKAATLHFGDDAQIGSWALTGVEEAVAAGYIDGFPNGTFQPLGTATRAQAARVLATVLKHTTA